MYYEDDEDMDMENLKQIIKKQNNFKKCMNELERTESSEEKEDILAEVFAEFIYNNLITSSIKKTEDYIS